MTRDHQAWHGAIRQYFARGRFADEACWRAVRSCNEWPEAEVLARAARGEPPFVERLHFASTRLSHAAESAAATLAELLTVAGPTNEVTLKIPGMLSEREVDSWTHRQGLSELMLLNVIEYRYDRKSGVLSVRLRDVKRRVSSTSVPESHPPCPDR